MAWSSPTERPYGPRHLFPHSRAACSLSPPQRSGHYLVSAPRGLLRRCQGHLGGAIRKKYGFWRGFVDTVVARYLDCGVAEACPASSPDSSAMAAKASAYSLSPANRGASAHPATPNAPLLLLLFSVTSYWKTWAIVSGHLPFPRCYDPTSCASGSFSGI